MGLSDIDEDDPLPSPMKASTLHPFAVPPVGAKDRAANKALDLDYLFGDMNLDLGIGASTQSPDQPTVASNTFVYKNAHDVLDNFFASVPLKPAPQKEIHFTKSATNQSIYVDYGERAAEDSSNLFDLSRPLEYKKFNNAESLLKAFENQGKKRDSDLRMGAENSLEHLTQNRDNNKIKARLLSLLNYYDILGVKSDATEEIIRRCYKKKALELHPDRIGHGQAPDEAALFKIITKAHDVLTDPEKRAEYDKEIQEAHYNSLNKGENWLHHIQPFC